MTNPITQADEFIRTCFKACERDGVKVDRDAQSIVFADAHRKLSDRMFRPDRIGSLGGPADASRSDRIHFIAAYAVWQAGLRPSLDAFVRLTAVLTASPAVAMTTS